MPFGFWPFSFGGASLFGVPAAGFGITPFGFPFPFLFPWFI
ncbi:hypothetical protein [Caldinitratiruptor microaerophilus]|uniref:Uncharacterized protein n=1 Tax=Caldinitratiruptor microaerophilus TaxID=671077 RepID=A0AA35CR38_9FIRM|nr:hypothetical protein [Caldinitratiruptor microaerophilus]BDG62260.1 hypothetical protein caldi_33500 [Caldinitratiruptor microaerophilus]